MKNISKYSFRPAELSDVTAITEIYEKTHELEQKGLSHTGWKKDIYPTEKTAEDAILKGHMYVAESDGKIIASARINNIQEKEYAQVSWKYAADPCDVLVIHTLVVDPDFKGKGAGKSFVDFYETEAKKRGCTVLRLDTNEINTSARVFYKKLGFIESGTIPTIFNGISGVNLVCLEKKL